jgi:hypothetical protein
MDLYSFLFGVVVGLLLGGGGVIGASVLLGLREKRRLYNTLQGL